MFDDLIVELDPPDKRRAKCDDGKERHLTEAAVMLAYGMHLLRTVPELLTVELHPDGEHGKRFEIVRWLAAQGFVLKERHGKTTYCGTHVKDQQSIVVASIPGEGDVVAKAREETIIAECKGGIVNTRHAGQTSRLRKVCARPSGYSWRERRGRQIAVVPKTETTLRLAQKLAHRAKDARN